MEHFRKPVLALAGGLALIAGSGVHAQGVLAPLTPGGPADSGSSYLADVLGSGPTSPESLTVSWSVSEDLSGIYTYSYTVFNPAGDIQLPGSVSPGSPEIVDYYSVNFDTTVAGALIPGSLFGGAYSAPNSTGVFWIMAPVQAGTSGPKLSFQSDLPPVYGNANASDANPPSPWSSSPAGQPVPVPNISGAITPEPDTLALFAVTASSALGVWRLRRRQ